MQIGALVGGAAEVVGPEVMLAEAADRMIERQVDCVAVVNGRRLVVLFGEVVLEDAGGGCPSERSVGSVVIVEVDEPVVGGSALGF